MFILFFYDLVRLIDCESAYSLWGESVGVFLKIFFEMWGQEICMRGSWHTGYFIKSGKKLTN